MISGLVSALPRPARRKLAAVRQHLRHISLRRRLLAAFAASAGMSALCGAMELGYVDHISKMLSQTFAVTSPLLNESVQLIDAAQRFRAEVDQLIDGDRHPGTPQRLTALHVEMQGRIDRLQQLTRTIGLDLKLELIQKREQRLSETGYAVREAVDRRNAATTAMEGGLDRLNTTMDGLHGAIAELVDRNEAAMERIEDGESDVVEHDAITADDAALVKGRFYPAIQGAGRLLRELDRINGQVQLTVAKDVRQHGPVAPFEPAPMFGAVDAVVSALSATPGDGRMQAAMGSVRHGVQSFKNLVRGMAADHAVFAAAAADIDANHRLLAAAQNGYLSLLAFVGRTIRAVEKDASAHAATDLGQAREGVIGIVLTTLLVGAAFSAAFA